MKKELQFKLLLITASIILAAGIFQESLSQNLRWLRVGQLQSFFLDYGAQCELTSFNNNFLTWPTQFGDNQYTTRAKAVWFGCKDYYDPIEKKQKTVKVVGAGPRYDAANQPQMIFPVSIKLISRKSPPVVVVDDQIGTNNTLYDTPDEIDEKLPCDRMIVVKYNTSIGVSVTEKILAFTQDNHNNYFVYDFVITNTGIYNRAGDVYAQKLKDFWLYFNYRYAFAGVTSSGFGSTWGDFSSEWGISTEFSDFGPYNGSDIHGFYGYYGPDKQRSAVTYDQDWGCPNHLVDGLLGSAKYAGGTTLFASKSAKDWTNDPNQPATTAYVGADIAAMNAIVSQFDEIFMGQRYSIMTEGHLPQTHEQAVGNQYIADWRTQHPDRDAGGGTSMGQGYGPYNLESGDSIHIVFAEGVSGISWEKCKEVGANWYAYFSGTGTPQLRMPDGLTTGNYTDYTRAWVQTGKDSIMQTMRNAAANFNASYNVPQAPPAPDAFTITSGGNKIHLSWSDNANSAPHFNGYVIYRSKGNVKDYRTQYEKIFECDRTNAVTSFDDVTASRGFNYYYYIQSKDDGSQNDVKPGVPLYSSLFLTITSVPAYLRRPPAPEIPIAPNSDSTTWKPMVNIEPWDSTLKYYKYDLVNTGGSDFVCIVDSMKSKVTPFNDPKTWRQTKLTGAWSPGSAYNGGDVVAYNGINFVTAYSFSAGSSLELVRVVPNPYDIRGRFLQFGDQSQYDRIAFYGLPPECKLKIFTERGDLIWEKDHQTGSGDELWNSTTSSGQIIVSGVYILYVEKPDGKSVFRKFVVIR